MEDQEKVEKDKETAEKTEDKEPSSDTGWNGVDDLIVDSFTDRTGRPESDECCLLCIVCAGVALLAGLICRAVRAGCCCGKRNDHPKKSPKGDETFNLGGKPNELSCVAKTVRANTCSGPSQRKVEPFTCNSHGNQKHSLNFHKERNRCLQEKKLFEDPEFPATDDSLFSRLSTGRAYPSNFRAKHGGYRWLRPGEIVRDPQFIVAGQTRFDANQGWLDDCSLCACIATLAMHEKLLYRVVPLDQSFAGHYAGIFHFQFWHYGKWVDVVIDDRLPTKDGHLVFLRSVETNEFWSALLEKAYAKLSGSYESLCDGFLADIMEEFTGGVVESFELKHCERHSLYRSLENAHRVGAMINCGIEKNFTRGEKGLVGGHAYSVTDFSKVDYCGSVVSLIRLRNPWGNQHQWTGPFSDKSAEWSYVKEESRKKLLVVADDGEFWMVLDDFLREFSTAHVCLLGEDCAKEIRKMSREWREREKSVWKLTCFHGEWSARKMTAGGQASGNIACNPQYLVHVPKDGDANTALVIEVMQKHERETRGYYHKKVGFAMIGCDGKRSTKLEQSAIWPGCNWIVKPTFRQARQEVKHVSVPSGDYVLIASTENGNQDGEFLLRIMSDQQISVRLSFPQKSLLISAREMPSVCK